ncbi:hypothetical protein ACHQM5_004318 [Ranunculus cassubicifolius]
MVQALEKSKQFMENFTQDNGDEKVELMRSFLQRQDPALLIQEVDDATLRRFLRARDLDIKKASTMFLAYLRWRESLDLKGGSISVSHLSNELAQKKMFLQGYDKHSRPIGVVFGKRHFPNKGEGGLDEFKRFVVYILDKMCARIPIGQEKFTIIADVEGWGYSNCDIWAYKGALSILQDYYPERLGKLFLLHVPYVFMAVWKVVSPFIDCNTRKKIVFVDNMRLTSTLLEDIDENQLPDIYGGKLPLVPIEVS